MSHQANRSGEMMDQEIRNLTRKVPKAIQVWGGKLADAIYDSFPGDELNWSVQVIEPSGEPSITVDGLRLKSFDELRTMEVMIGASIKLNFDNKIKENVAQLATVMRELAVRLDEIGKTIDPQAARAA